VPSFELHMSTHPVPETAYIARELRADGVRSAELLDLAIGWGNDRERAWNECERLELIYPIAILRGASRPSILRGLRELVVAGRALLPRSLDWELVDRELAAELLDGAIAPDLDLTHLEELRWRANDRLAVKTPARHRQHLMRACSCVAELAMRGDSPMLGASAPAYMAPEHVLGALVDEDGAADLFSSRIDVAAFVAAELERARSST
jgi:hypothetical protein